MTTSRCSTCGGQHGPFIEAVECEVAAYGAERAVERLERFAGTETAERLVALTQGREEGA